MTTEGEVRLPLSQYNKLRDDHQKSLLLRKRTEFVLNALDSFLNSISQIEEVQNEILVFNQAQQEVRFTIKNKKLMVQLLNDNVV